MLDLYPSPTGTIARLEQRLEHYRTLSFEQLECMPDCSETHLGNPEDEIKALLWIDKLEVGQLRVVLQSCQAGFCCITEVRAIGFLVTSTGERLPLSDELLDEFRLQES